MLGPGRVIGGGVQLAAWLRVSRCTRENFADTLGITPAYLCQILHGVRRPKLETLMRIAELTGIPIVAWADTRMSKMDERANRPVKKPEVSNELLARRVS